MKKRITNITCLLTKSISYNFDMGKYKSMEANEQIQIRPRIVIFHDITISPVNIFHCGHEDIGSCITIICSIFITIGRIPYFLLNINIKMDTMLQRKSNPFDHILDFVIRLSRGGTGCRRSIVGSFWNFIVQNRKEHILFQIFE